MLKKNWLKNFFEKMIEVILFFKISSKKQIGVPFPTHAVPSTCDSCHPIEYPTHNSYGMLQTIKDASFHATPFPPPCAQVPKGRPQAGAIIICACSSYSPSLPLPAA